ncbi:amidase [uncultured Rhodoblastus sp.]|uniref:amidase n=1 Tax=uncultured Rhodoblastus sp. TaxID=543037 RepID=UPI0025FD44F4|nr:amidase [uncultured Rhodoblastus sp.]
MNELWTYSAVELAAGIAQKDFSCAEVVEAHLRRIEAVNPRVNAVVRILADEARRDAVEADRKVAAGAPLGPLHGVPFTIKDNIDVAGHPTTHGLPVYADAVAPSDAPVVERMRAAGAIAIGRTNLPDLGVFLSTESTLYGLTKNPWNPERTVGGSSGGEGAALATGMSPMGLGNDSSGSLRNPANATGVATIKPTQWRVPDASFQHQGQMLFYQLFVSQGPMARRIRDVRVALGVLEGAHPRDPWSLDPPVAPPLGTAPLRVAMVSEPPGGPTAPVIAEVVRNAGGALRDAGYEVVEILPPRYEETLHLKPQIESDEMRYKMKEFAAKGKYLKSLYAPVTDSSAEVVLNRYIVRHELARLWSQFMAEYPLVLSPVWAQLPFEVGFDLGTPESAYAAYVIARPVLPANLFGLPSACVSAGRDLATGLPIGVLLTGRRMRDGECLDAAEAIEARLGLKTPIDPG